MEFLFFLFLMLGFSLRSAWSSPIEARSPPARECAIVDDIVLLLKLTGATPFCSSFLSIPAATSVSTIASAVTAIVTTSPLTVATTTEYSSTETDITSITSTTTTLVTVVTTDIITSTATVLTTATSTLFTDLGRRAVQQQHGIPIPSVLQKFASSAISTACSCLNIPQSTFKTTTTTVSTIPATATSFVTETILAVTTTDTTTVILTDLVVPTSTTTIVGVITTETIGTIATDCPQALQDPGFENGKNAAPWVATSNANEDTYNEVYAGVPQYAHSGEDSYIFTYFNDNDFDGSLIFSLAQTANICPHQRLTLGFWLRWDYDNSRDTCTMQVCMATQCQVFNVIQGSTSNNQYVHYSFLGPVPNGSTTMTISVSANGGTAGNCVGSIVYFDDFTLE